MNRCAILLLVAITCQALLVHAQYEALLAASLFSGQGSGGSGGSGIADLFGGTGGSSIPSSNIPSLTSLPGLQSLGSSSSSGSSSTGKAAQMMSALGVPGLGSQAGLNPLARLGGRSATSGNIGSLLSSSPGLGSMAMTGLMGGGLMSDAMVEFMLCQKLYTWIPARTRPLYCSTTYLQ